MERSIVRRSESRFEGAQGRSLFRRSWLPSHPEFALALVHGYAEHSGRYDHFGSWFASQGAAVHAYDHQGHGRSGGPRGHVRRFDDLLDDLEVFLRRVADEHAGLPVVLVGHSMGGLVVTAFARERSGPIAAAAASAPPLKISEAISQTRVRAARLLRSVAPRLSLASGLDPNGLSRDVAVVQRYLDDPLVHRRMTTSLACELLGAVQRTAAAGPEAIQLPFLILHGDSDPICPLEGSRTFSEKLRTLGSELRVYPGLRHEIFNEPEYEDVFADLIAWFRGRLADAVPRPREAGRAR